MSREPRKLGQLLSDSLSESMAGIGEYVPIVALGLIPSLVVMLLVSAAAPGEASPFRALLAAGRVGTVLMISALGLIGAIARAWAWLALILAAALRQRGEKPGIGQAFRRSAGYAFPMIWTEFLVLLYVAGGLILLIIPGILFGIWYGFSHLCVLMEGLSGSAALSRSKQIVRARMGKVVGNMFVAILVSSLAAGVIAAAIYLGLSLLGFHSSGLWTRLAMTVLTRIIGIWPVVFSVFLYTDLALARPSE